ncbi:LacI family transcriptional regulator [Bifidobacterium avesanii]|nr:LacI family transcriptional regulator [Bifidobacterium avesanii]
MLFAMTASQAPRRKQAKPQLSQLAREIGVSAATVSKVVHGHPDVSDKTREKVEQALERAGYRRPATARPHSGYLEIAFRELDELWSMEMLRGLQACANEHGMNVSISELHTLGTPSDDWVEGLIKRNPVGVLLVFTDLTAEQAAKLARRHIPHAVSDPRGNALPGSAILRSDSWNGGVTATRHLIALGHTRIACISGNRIAAGARAREDGYRFALDEAGIPFDPDLCLPGEFTSKTGYEQALKLLRLPNRPTAIFTGNDLQALGAYKAARECGLRIPEDLSIVGFDDIPTAAMMAPALTTIRNPIAQLAHKAGELLIAMQQGQPVPHETVFPTSLVVRESTTAPPTQA